MYLQQKSMCTVLTKVFAICQDTCLLNNLSQKTQLFHTVIGQSTTKTCTDMTQFYEITSLIKSSHQM